jgi:hypothetical protein
MGFYVPESGQFINKGNTRYAFAALFSPRAYDTYLRESFEKVRYTLLNDFENFGYVRGQVRTATHEKSTFLRRNSELLLSFREKGFSIPFSTIQDEIPELSEMDEIAELSSMNEAIVMTTGFVHVRNFIENFRNEADIVQSDGRRERMERRIGRINELNSYGNHLFFSHFLVPHGPFVYNADGSEKTNDEMMRQEVYRGHYLAQAFIDQYVFALRFMVSSKEEILLRDPTAVIVIIGDHGLPTATQYRMFGYDIVNDPVVNDIILHEIFVALRLPECADVENNPIFEDPHNITRYLINTFVGQNYEYIIRD